LIFDPTPPTEREPTPEHAAPARLDFYRARIVDGLGHIIHERLFVVELSADGAASLRELDILGNLTPADAAPSPPVASLPEPTSWLNEHVLIPFLDEVRGERLAEIDRVATHVELSLTEDRNPKVRIEFVGNPERVRLQTKSQQTPITLIREAGIGDGKVLEVSLSQRNPPELLRTQADQASNPGLRPVGANGLHPHRLAE
jgi:hypothetical protein